MLPGVASLDEAANGRTVSTSPLDTAGTRLGRRFAPLEAAHPGQSGFDVLGDGREALLSRSAIADQADRSLDVQYYIYAADRSGIALLARLKAAADRGVHVRILVDDNNLAVSDVVAAQVNGHPNIEVRIFNPFAGRSRWMRPFEALSRFKRLNRRMHNKIFAADNQVAIIGGRNVGDDYFDADPRRNFADVDLLAIGPVVRQATQSFDEFWNSKYAIAPEAFLERRPTREAIDRLLADLDASAAAQPTLPAMEPAAQDAYMDSLARDAEALAWGEAQFIHDPVGKVSRRGSRVSVVAAALVKEWQAADREVLLASAYFVPRRFGLRLARDAERRGVQVSVLTNSLASNDVALVHAGYAKYRRRLVNAGVQLHEFRRSPEAEAAGPRSTRLRGGSTHGSGSTGGSSEASLHTKMAVFDREVSWVGSFNFDPRSTQLNTEVGLLVRSPALAERLVRLFERDTLPERAWTVQVEPAPPGHVRHFRRGRLQWVGTKRGQPVVLYAEPGTSLGLRLWVSLAAWIPGLDQML
jgi:cardiolipin synthase C